MSALPIAFLLDPKEERKHREREVLETSAASLGGLLGGNVAGALLINPANVRHLRKLEQQTPERQADFARNKELLEALRDLNSGRKKWSDVTPEAEPVLREMFQEHQSLLNDPFEMAVAMKQKPPADILRFPGTPKRLELARLLPSQDMLRHPARILAHPIPATLGLLGALGAGYAMDRHHDQRFYERLKELAKGEGEPDATHQ